MPKSVTSPSKLWPGTVTLADPLTLPQVELIEAGLELPEGLGEKVYFSVLDKMAMPAIIACVEKWNLENFPEAPTLDNWPMTPRKQSHEFVAFLWSEVVRIYNGEQDAPVPND